MQFALKQVDETWLGRDKNIQSIFIITSCTTRLSLDHVYDLYFVVLRGQ